MDSTGFQFSDQADQVGQISSEPIIDQSDALARDRQLPDVELNSTGLKITPLTPTLPPEADALREKSPRCCRTSRSPTSWSKSTSGRVHPHFVHLRNGDAQRPHTPADRHPGRRDQPRAGPDGGACPGTSLSRLSWIADWHVRDETYSKGLAEIVNHHRRQPFAGHWGEGTTSSSDGQRFRAGGVGEARGK